LLVGEQWLQLAAVVELQVELLQHSFWLQQPFAQQFSFT